MNDSGDGEPSALVDLLAIATRSIIRNLGPSFVKPFLDAYGQERADREKIEYYRMLDELF